MKETNSKKTVILVVVAILFILLAVFAYSQLGPNGVTGSKVITIKVNHLVGDDSSFEIKTNEEYLRGALEQEKLISGEENQYGLFIKTVDKESADDSKKQWWGFTVNGEFSENGVDTQPISDGDIYEFKLNEGY